ncbi:hypothetical protein ACGFIX_33885 [Nocardia salmonicida]|uniref:hypothetical protein n=1 Tax=Nocardia salmonicida TaxID=53431 RepID=UPI003722A992
MGSDEYTPLSAQEIVEPVQICDSNGVQVGDNNTQNNTTNLNIGQLNINMPPVVSAPSPEDRQAAVDSTVARSYRRNKLTRPPVMAAHPSIGMLVGRLRAVDGCGVVVVHGRAGSGKSTVTTEAVRELIDSGWAAAAVRMDGIDGVCRTAKALGVASDLPGSPVVALGAEAQGRPCLLVVDQLDAVSTYSGRMPDSFEAVVELIEQAHDYPRMKIVLSVRTADLTADPRMRAILADREAVEKFEIAELTDFAVGDVLTKLGTSAANCNEATLELLRVPLHLAVFSRLSAESRQLTYRTLPDLYDRFTLEIVPKIEGDLGSQGWSGATSALVEYMDTHEVLQAPVGVLNNLPVQARSVLISAGILVEHNTNLAFFHETYFDFLFARAFIATGQDLHKFLINTDQQLFRRAQTRQVLEHLISTDKNRFRDNVVQILRSSRIRSHLLDVVVAVLNGLHADDQDWLTIEPIAFGSFRRSKHLINLLTNAHWFDAADSAGRWQSLLTQPNTAQSSADMLIGAARERGQRVHELVVPFIGTTAEWDSRLRSMIEWSMNSDLVELAVDLMQRGILDEARGPIASNSDFWSILYGLKADDPAGAVRVVGAYLERARIRANKDGAKNPFGRHISNSTGGGESTLDQVSTAAPKEYISNILPFVMKVLQDTEIEDQNYISTGSPWDGQYYHSHGIAGAVLDGLESALCLIAQQEWNSADSILPDLARKRSKVTRFLACRAYRAAPVQAATAAVEWLISDDRNLRLGWADSPRLASRELIEEVSQYCSEPSLQELLERILDYYPPWEYSYRNHFGRAQYELLSAVDLSRLTPLASQRLQELQRKFSVLEFDTPRPAIAQFVGPPVPEEASDLMSDMDWHRAIAKYSKQVSADRGDFTLGGSRELASLLGRRAKDHPDRFAALALTWDSSVPEEYYVELIEGIADNAPAALLGDVCVHADRIVGQPAAHAICRAIARNPHKATAPLLDLIVGYSAVNDPTHSPRPRSQCTGTRNLDSEGLNSTRGLSAYAIGMAVFERDELAQRFLPIVKRLSEDRVLSVRAQAARPLLALLKTHQEDVMAIAYQYFDESPIELHFSGIANELLRQTLARNPDRLAGRLNQLLLARDPLAEAGGSIWANALLNGLLPADAPQSIALLGMPARRSAAAVIASAPAIAPDVLTTLFGDDDEMIRERAAIGMRSIHNLAIEVAEALVEGFTSSIAFADHMGDLFSSLVRSNHLLPSTAIRACEQAAEQGGADLGNIRTARAVVSPDIVTVVLRLYRQGDNEMRRRCLDVVDCLSDMGAYGLSDALRRER